MKFSYMFYSLCLYSSIYVCCSGGKYIPFCILVIFSLKNLGGFSVCYSLRLSGFSTFLGLYKFRFEFLLCESSFIEFNLSKNMKELFKLKLFEL